MFETLRGSITAVGFSSGHRFVIGNWAESPIGPFADVMWRGADEEKRLIAAVGPADYVDGVYPFDTQLHHEVTVRSAERSSGDERRNSKTLVVEAGPLKLDLTLGRFRLPFPPRPRVVTTSIENRIGRALLGVNTYGVSPTGVEEWYRTRSVSRVIAASGSIDGQDLGAIGEVARPLGFGFTDPPRTPSSVDLRVDLRRPG